ncbi:TetR family transcriptional regulator [Pseudomonas aeruginosa]|uniref:TetR/AcrR family transcriptional regulator n=1 Tax=Pseudomonas aeruginosa TaxID=287 RepID=UPI00032B773E|nr:TetR/AcrR family transcriptional regulator [Pseudomonas aeruginosa]AGL46288.1 TetR family transcriptional regulator [Pseudomonas aeruginosa PA96]KSH14856.1 TetR family transcriptional regulator [Pseudomonas aeruginosa]MCT5019984.1 TetR/AcrR family transcriptional regulator [Pseudomonas aeruginosa]ORL52578.1 TetR family transcriptional regulator [Pseudomonas aeruginosa]
MQEKRTSRSNQERTESTRSALIAAARRLFVERGYAATGTPDIVSAAAVTRGALYHHFEDKAALFFAVTQQMAQEVASAIEAGSSQSGSPLDALMDGSHAYFQSMAECGRAQLLLQDAPAVLNAQQLAQLSDMAGAYELEQGLGALLMGNDVSASIAPEELHALTQLVSAAFDRTAQALAQKQSIAFHQAALHKLLQGLCKVYAK